MKKKPKENMSLSKAYMHGGKLLLIALASMMIFPLATDLYRVGKKWLLKEEE